MLFNSSALSPGDYPFFFTRKYTSRSRFSDKVHLFLTLRLPCLDSLLSRQSVNDEIWVVLCRAVILLFSLLPGFRLESSFPSALFTLASLSPELQTLTPSDSLFGPLSIRRTMICAPPFLYFIVSTSVGRCFGGDYCQPKDLLCGNEGRKARFPTLRIESLANNLPNCS